MSRAPRTLRRIAALAALGCAFAACFGEEPPAASEPEPAVEEPARDPEPEPEPAPEPSAPPPSPKPAPPPPAPEPEPAPPDAGAAAMSLDELAERIKATSAIGTFTKLALKNDIDDLVDALRSHHEDGEGRLAELHEHYEALVLKLLALLEDDEPDLAAALARSRETLWSRLADPAGFVELTT